MTRVLGMISGTSHDGIDAAVVEFTTDGDTLRAVVEHTTSIPYDAALRARIIAALPPRPTSVDEVCRLDALIGQAFAAVAADAVDAVRALPGAPEVDLVCSHGQTVFHWVEQGRALGTLQLGQPSWIAEATGVLVVADVRSADVAAGGQGAPLVPVLDRLLLEPLRENGACAGALNLGGISNLTVCAPDADPVAWDIGPAGALVDAVVTRWSDGAQTFDRDGELAKAGQVDADLLRALLAEPYYALTPPKSSGKELFHLDHVDDAVRRAGVDPALPDLVATLTELTAVTVADALRDNHLDVVVAAGGGVRNPVLMQRIGELAPDVRVMTTDDLGVPPGEKEAVAFALIGWATLHGLPGNVPSCTGASGPRVLGSITAAPGRPLPVVEPIASWPRRIELSTPGGSTS